MGEPAGRGVSVFVVDSGVNPHHSHVRGVAGGARVFKGTDGAIRREEGNFRDDLGHGTAITAVIRHVAPAARIHAVKIFSGSRSVTVDVLEAAVAYAVDAGARVVNLSLGVEEDVGSRPIGALSRDAADRGVILVASGRNGSRRNGYPALLPDVIGVAADRRLGERSLRYRAGLSQDLIPQKIKAMEVEATQRITYHNLKKQAVMIPFPLEPMKRADCSGMNPAKCGLPLRAWAIS